MEKERTVIDVDWYKFSKETFQNTLGLEIICDKIPVSNIEQTIVSNLTFCVIKKINVSEEI